MGPGPRGRAAACIPRSGSAALNRAPARLAAEEGTEEEEEAGSEQALVHQARQASGILLLFAHSRGTSRGVLRDTPAYRSAQSTVDTRRVDPLQCPRLRLLSALSCDSIWTGAGAYTRTPRASLPGTSARRRRVTRPTDPRPCPSAFSPVEPPRPNPRRSARRAARAGGGSIRRFVSATRRAACGQERTRAGGARARRDHGAPPQLAHGRRGAHLHGGRSLGAWGSAPRSEKKSLPPRATCDHQSVFPTRPVTPVRKGAPSTVYCQS